MASYDALINLKVKGLDKLSKVEKAVNNINGKGTSGSRSGSRRRLTDEEKLVKEKIKGLITENRAIKTQTTAIGLKKKGLNFAKTDRKLKIAIANAQRGQIDDANLLIQKATKSINLAKKELALENKTTKAVVNTNRAKSKGNRITKAAIRSGVSSSVFGSTAQPGSPKFIASRAGMMQGPALPPVIQGPTSPIGGTRFMFGSPAQRAFSGGPRSPIRGTKSMAGSPAALAALAGGKGSGALQSALISGAFPLLFGQGPLGGAAGFAGGFLGTKMGGQMGGFAGGLVATAAVSAIQQAISATAKLGQAFNEFNLDVSALTKSLGVTGTATSQYLKTLEAVKGPLAAANEAQERLRSIIGDKGVEDLKEFGKRSQIILNSTQKFFTRMTAGLAGILNFADKFLGISKGLEQRDIRKFGMTDDDEELVRLRGELKELGKNKLTRRDDADFIKKFAEIDARAKQVMTGQTQKDFIDNATLALDSNIEKLEETLALGTKEAKIQQEIASILKEKNILRNAENKEAIDLIEKGVRRKNQLQEQIKLFEQIKTTIADGMVNAIDALIDKTKSLNDVLASVVKQIGRAFLSAGINALVGNISFGGPKTTTVGNLPSVLPAAKGAFVANGIKPFATGGMATRPTLGLVGEAGEDEYVIPASKMSSAMQRYSAGARGESVIPGTGSSQSVGSAGSSTVVNYMGPTLNFNGDEYVPRSAVGDIIATATARGAAIGESRTISSLKNSRGRRASLGL